MVKCIIRCLSRECKNRCGWRRLSNFSIYLRRSPFPLYRTKIVVSDHGDRRLQYPGRPDFTPDAEARINHRLRVYAKDAIAISRRTLSENRELLLMRIRELDDIPWEETAARDADAWATYRRELLREVVLKLREDRFYIVPAPYGHENRLVEKFATSCSACP